MKIRNNTVMKTITGKHIDLADPQESDFDIIDIAFALGRILRFNGHIRQDYTVAHHCLLMSHAVPEEHALEALLHDAAEAYMGDIIMPAKSLFDSGSGGLVSRTENAFLLKLMRALMPEEAFDRLHKTDSEVYIKSDAVKEADVRLVQHEWAVLERGDEYEPDKELADLSAELAHTYYEDYLSEGQPWWAYIRRYCELVGKEYNFDDICGVLFPVPEDEAIADAAIGEMRERYEEENGPLTEEEWSSLLENIEEMAKAAAENEEAQTNAKSAN